MPRDSGEEFTLHLEHKSTAICGPGGKMPESKWELGDFYNEWKLSTKSQITTIWGWRQGYSQSKILVNACASVGEGTGTPPWNSALCPDTMSPLSHLLGCSGHHRKYSRHLPAAEWPGMENTGEVDSHTPHPLPQDRLPTTSPWDFH